MYSSVLSFSKSKLIRFFRNLVEAEKRLCQATLKRILVILVFQCFVFLHMAHGQVKTLSQPGFQWHEPTAWIPIGVPTANDSVVIGGLTFIMPDSTGLAKYVHVTAGGELDIQRDVAANKPGRLRIVNAPGRGFLNEGELEVGGRLTIRNSHSVALENQGRITVLDRAKVIIDSTTVGKGIVNATSIICEGEISIENTDDDGLSNMDSLTIEKGGSLSVTKLYGADAIVNQMDAVVINNGRIALCDIDLGDGMVNMGWVFNQDSLVTIDIYEDGIDNLSQFINGESAYIHTVNTGSYSIYSRGVYFENQGIIDIDSAVYGIFILGIFENHDSILIDVTSDWSIELLDTFYNRTDGVIRVMNAQNNTAINADGHFENEGSIHCLSGIGVGIDNNEVFINKGFIEVLNPEFRGIMNDQGSFTNEGKIEITASKEQGLLNRSMFVNSDTLIIVNSSFSAIENQDTLINEAGAFIDIDNIGQENHAGIENGQGTSYDELFLNEGSIKIRDAWTYAVWNRGVFKITSTGFLEVLETIDNPLQVDQNAVFECLGTVELKD